MSSRESIIKALNLEHSGDWEGAHRMVQQMAGSDAARVHAYLHRVEGDQSNADYWYRNAGVERPHASTKAEWQALWDRFND